MSIFEKWLEFTPHILSLYAKWDPEMMIHKHGQNRDHILFVLQGKMMCGAVNCTKTRNITLEQDAAFGPHPELEGTLVPEKERELTEEPTIPADYEMEWDDPLWARMPISQQSASRS